MQKLRRAAHLRQRDVAALFPGDETERITTSAVSSWERGKTAPAIHRLAVLDAAYGANGAVLKLYDVPVESAMKAEIRLLRERLNQTDEVVAELASSHRRLSAEVAELRARRPGQGLNGVGTG